MATIVNARDVLLQAAATRYTPIVELFSSTLSLYACALPADPFGTVTSFSGAVTTMTVYRGSVDDSANWSFSGVGTGVTFTQAGVTFTVTGLSADVGYIDITATRTDFPTQTKRFTVTKAKAGTNGTNGTNGSPGANGQRGSLTLYASGSSWSDTTANNAIISATGSSTKVIGDTVTISNGSSFAATKYWSGSAWVDPGVVLNGNLLVNGTVSGNVINGGRIGGVTIGIGTGSSSGGYAFEVNSAGTVWVANIISSGGGFFEKPGSASTATLAATAPNSSNVAIEGLSPSGISSHGVRGNSVTGGASGLVGTSIGKAFHAESGTAGPFTGSHDSILPKGYVFERGDVMEDVELIASYSLNDTLYRVQLSSAPYSKRVRGVATRVDPMDNFIPAALLAGWEDEVITVFEPNPEDPETLIERHLTRKKQVAFPEYDEIKDAYDIVTLNALGEGQVNVCGEGGDIEAGDLLVTSSIPGKLMRQDDDIIRSYTVARAASSVIFGSPTDVALIPCIYFCG